MDADDRLRVLVVAADSAAGRSLEAVLRDHSIDIHVVVGLSAAVAAALRSPPAIVFLDADVISAAGAEGHGTLRARLAWPIMLVGVARQSVLSGAALLSADLDAILHEPVRRSDIERLLTLAAAGAAAGTPRELTIAERLYRELVERLPIGMVVCDPTGRIELVNAAMTALTGLPAEALIGTAFSELLLDGRAIPWSEWRQDVAGSAEPVVLQIRGPRGRRLITRCRGRILRLPRTGGVDGGSLERVQITVEDITLEQRRLHEFQLLLDLTQLVAVQGDMELAFHTVAERLVRDLGYRIVGLATLARDGQHLEGRAYQGDAAVALRRWSVDTGITGRAIRENRSILVRDVRESADYLEVDPRVTSELAAVIRVADTPVGVLDVESDESRPLDESDLALVESIAVHLGLLLDQIEVTERLAQQARTDPGTGIPNRRVLIERLQALTDPRRAQSAAVFLIDIDQFKLVNDRYGHLVGDVILQQVVHRLAGSLRPHDLLARYAGDELAVVLNNLGPDVAVEVAERLRRAVADTPFQHDGLSVPLTVSIGVVLYPEQGATPEELLASADGAMYAAKTSGGNAFRGERLAG